MKNSNDRIIEDYIERVLELRQSQTQGQSLQQADLEALALELGMTADDIDAAKQQAQKHLTRGESYLEYERWNDAIDELKQAAALNPVDLYVLHPLALAYQSRYREKLNPADKVEVISLAKQCLAIQPDDVEAIKLMNALDQPVNGPDPKALWFFGSGILVAILMIVAGPKLTALINRPEPIAKPTVEQTVPAEETSELESVEKSEQTSSNSSQPTPELDIPIEFDAPGIAIEPRISRLNNYTDSSFYKLEGVLANNSNQELVALRLKVDYLDAQGNIMATDSAEALSDSDAALRPGDTYAFNLLEKLNPDLAQVRLSVTTLDQSPAATAYEPSPSVDVTWGFTQPANLEFAIAARSDQFKNYSTSSYHDAVFEITNTGEVAIEKLKLQIDFYDAKDKLIGSEDILIVYGDDTPMLPGELRPKRSIRSVPKTYASYRLTVLEAE